MGLVLSEGFLSCAVHWQVKYNQLGIGDPMFTYGVMFVPDNPVAVPPWQDRVPDKQLGRGCYWYQVSAARHAGCGTPACWHQRQHAFSCSALLHGLEAVWSQCSLDASVNGISRELTLLRIEPRNSAQVDRHMLPPQFVSEHHMMLPCTALRE